ncbi:MAG TPA: VacJ family lipoprotein [Candidatus Binataceae bacterium]|nr:VacJ family lipoprotein [Candidatus Binataceae bacterium]
MNEPIIGVAGHVRRSCRWTSAMVASLAVAALAAAFVRPALAADQAPVAQPKVLPGEGGGPYPDPLSPFNEAMFTFNLNLDEWVVTPVAKGYSYVMPEPARKSVGRFFDNVSFLPRFANNLFQLRFVPAGTELARFGINTTLGVVGLFDVADDWFGLKEQPDDFGLTMGHYGIYSGPYIMLPFFGPSTIRDTVGLAVDATMNPMYWLVPWWISMAANAGSEAVTAVNYRSLHPNQFEEADRYAVDLYGAVQDAYMQTRAAELKRISR